MVFIGGGLGSICRYGIARWLVFSTTQFPWATWLANVISCIVLGLVLGWTLRSGMDTSWKLLLITGFCGGFSTFSTFSLETLQLLQNGAWTYALLNVFLNLLVCLICIYLGTKLILSWN